MVRGKRDTVVMPVLPRWQHKITEPAAHDSADVGWYMNGISHDLQYQVRKYTRSAINNQNGPWANGVLRLCPHAYVPRHFEL